MNPTLAVQSDTDIADELCGVLKELVKAVVANPDAVQVTYTKAGKLIAFVIKPDQQDVRRVVGAKGKHIKAMEVIIGAMAKIADRESRLIIDENPNFGLPSTAARAFSFGAYNPKRFQSVIDALRRVVENLVEEPSKLKIESTDAANTSIINIMVPGSDYGYVYGTPTTFDYGEDGNVIGSIKNLFDGIGKNHGRVLLIALTRV